MKLIKSITKTSVFSLSRCLHLFLNRMPVGQSAVMCLFLVKWTLTEITSKTFMIFGTILNHGGNTHIWTKKKKTKDRSKFLYSHLLCSFWVWSTEHRICSIKFTDIDPLLDLIINHLKLIIDWLLSSKSWGAKMDWKAK